MAEEKGNNTNITMFSELIVLQCLHALVLKCGQIMEYLTLSLSNRVDLVFYLRGAENYLFTFFLLTSQL